MTGPAPTPSSPPSPPPTASTPPAASPPSPPAGPTSPFAGLTSEEKDKIINQQAQALRDNARTSAEMKAQIDELRKKVDAPPPPDPKAESKKFYDQPVETTREIVRHELQETIKPLNEFKDELKKDRDYDRIKTKFRSDPTYADFFKIPGAEAMIDEAMSRLPATDAAMTTVLFGLRGAAEFGHVPALKAPPKPPAGPDVTPPHLRPSPPPDEPPATRDAREAEYIKGEVGKLDENARRLIREMGQTPEDFIRWRDLEAEQVTSSKIGIKPPAPAGAK